MSNERHDWYKNIFAAGEARAKVIRDTARPCEVCGRSMLNWGGGRKVHFSCDPELPLAGKVCTCPVGCSDTHWGTGGVPCDQSCVPCRIMRGKPLRGKKD